MSATHDRICEIIKDSRLDETTRRRYAIWAVEQVARRVRIPGCIHAFETAKAHVAGKATDEELEAAWKAAHDGFPGKLQNTDDLAAHGMLSTASRYQDVFALGAAGDAARVLVLHRLKPNHSELDYDLAMEEEHERHLRWLEDNVTITPKTREITAALDRGETVPGIRARKEARL